MPPGAGGPIATRIENAQATTAAPRAPRFRGAGHHAHTATTAPAIATTATEDNAPSGIDAYGTAASLEATVAVRAPREPDRCRTNSPAGAATRDRATPTSPRVSTPETKGPASRLATGEIIDHAPNVDTVSGMVTACAVSVSAIGGANGANARGIAAAVHAAARREKVTNPATASTDSWNPKSNATGGHAATAATMATHTAPRPSARRPDSDAPVATPAIAHARTADAWTPVVMT